MNRIGLFLVFLLIGLASTKSFAQVRIGEITGNGNNSAWIWDEQAALADREIVPNPPATFFRLPSNLKLSTEPLKKIYPEENIPDEEFDIVLPPLLQEIDTLCLMLYLELPDSPERAIVNTVLVTNYGTKNTRYYIDANNNRDYTDDGSPVRFNFSQEYKVVTISIKNENGFRQRYKFQLPNLNLNESLKEQFVSDEAIAFDKRTITPTADSSPLNSKSRLSIVLGIGTGSGNASFSVDAVNDPNNVSKRTFDARFASTVQLTVGASYSFFKNLNVGGLITYESNHTSESNQQIFNGPGTQSGFDVATNSGNWPESLVSFGGFLEYNIKLKPNLYFAPTIQYSTYSFVGGKTFLTSTSRHVTDITAIPESNNNDTFINKAKLTYGGKIKFNLNTNSIMFIGAARTETYFDPSSDYFLDTIDADSFDLEFSQFIITVGAELVINKRQ